MEFNARYALNGLFAVVVVLAMFGFVYWLNNSTGFGERQAYQIRFTVPVSGLSRGSDVLFNGVKVGQVDSIHLDAAEPEHLIAMVSVVKGVPIRTDTVAGIDYQGLTGAASILLTGGSVGAPAPSAPDGAVPQLVADPGASRSWLQKASRILGTIDDVLENNKGRFDAILAGLERLAGGGSDKEVAVTNDLPAPTDLTPPGAVPEWQLAVSEPSVVLALNTDRVLEQVGEAGSRPLGDERWTDSLPNLIQARLIQSFENAGLINVLRPADAADPDYSLNLDIRKFWWAESDGAADIDLMAKIIDRDGKLVAARRFETRIPARPADADPAVEALRAAFTATARDLVSWVIATL